MNGASGTNGNYLEFPDGTQQTTAYTGSTGGVTGGVAILDASSQTFSGVNTFSNTGASGGIRVNNLMITNTTDINDEYVGNITYNSSNNNNLSIISYNDLYFNIGNSGVGGGTAFVGGYMDMSGYHISNVPLIQSVNDLNLKSGTNLILTAGATEGNGTFALVAGNATLRLNTNDKSYSSIVFDTNENYSRMKLYNSTNGEKGYLAIILNSGSEDLKLESVNNLYLQAGGTSNNTLTISGTNINLNSTNNYIRINNSVDSFINFGFPVDYLTNPIDTFLTFYKEGGSASTGGGAISFHNSDTVGIGQIYADGYQRLNLTSNTGGITLTSKIKQYSLNGASNVNIYEWTDGIYAFVLFNSNSSNDGYCEFIINKDLNVSILAIGGGGDGGYSYDGLFNTHLAIGGGGGGGGGFISANAQLKKSASPYVINIGGSTSGNSPENGKDCGFVNGSITVKATGGMCSNSTNPGYGGSGGVPIGGTNDPIPALDFNYLTNGQPGGNGAYSDNAGDYLPTSGGSTSNPNPYPGPGIGISWGNGGGGGASSDYVGNNNKGGNGGNGGIGGNGPGGGGGGGTGGGNGAIGYVSDSTSGSGGDGGNSPCSYTNKAGSYGQGGGGASYLGSNTQNQFGRGSPGCVLITMLRDDIYEGTINMDTQFSKPLPLSNNYNLVWNSETQELYKDPNSIQSGVIANIYSLFDNTKYYYSITFSVAFSDIPNVVCNLARSTSGAETPLYAIYSFIDSISTTGFKFYAVTTNAVITQAMNVSVNWIAKLSS